MPRVYRVNRYNIIPEQCCRRVGTILAMIKASVCAASHNAHPATTAYQGSTMQTCFFKAPAPSSRPTTQCIRFSPFGSLLALYLGPRGLFSIGWIGMDTSIKRPGCCQASHPIGLSAPEVLEKAVHASWIEHIACVLEHIAAMQRTPTYITIH